MFGEPSNALPACVWTPLVLPPYLETQLQSSPGQLVCLVPNQRYYFQARTRVGRAGLAGSMESGFLLRVI